MNVFLFPQEGVEIRHLKLTTPRTKCPEAGDESQWWDVMTINYRTALHTNPQAQEFWRRLLPEMRRIEMEILFDG